MHLPPFGVIHVSNCRSIRAVSVFLETENVLGFAFNKYANLKFVSERVGQPRPDVRQVSTARRGSDLPRQDGPRSRGQSHETDSPPER